MCTHIYTRIHIYNLQQNMHIQSMVIFAITQNSSFDGHQSARII